MSEHLQGLLPDVPLLALVPKLEPSEQLRLASTPRSFCLGEPTPTSSPKSPSACFAAVSIPLTVGLFGPGADSLTADLTSSGLLPKVYPSGGALLEAVIADEVRGVLCAPEPGGRVARGFIQLLRSERAGRTIVIGCFASEPEERLAALQTGADCFWTTDRRRWPRSPSSCTPGSAAVRSIDASLSEVSDNTAVPWNVGSVLIQRLMRDGARSKTSVAIALLRLSEDSVRDDQIAQSFRRSDIVTRRDARSLVIALRGAERAVLMRRLQGTIENLRPRAAGVRSAVIEYPTDARTASQALSRADAAIDRSETLGRSRDRRDRLVP